MEKVFAAVKRTGYSYRAEANSELPNFSLFAASATDFIIVKAEKGVFKDLQKLQNYPKSYLRSPAHLNRGWYFWALASAAGLNRLANGTALRTPGESRSM